MDHKERCRQLKEIRKNVADQIGVDLHQRECTYEGECSGTCPKCAQEESALNKALLAGAAVATSVMLSACNVENPFANLTNKMGKQTNDPDVEMQITGDEAYIPPDCVVDNLEGDAVEVDGPDEYQLDGDITYIEEGEVEYVPETLEGIPDVSKEEDAIIIARNYTGAPIVEVDQVNEDGSYLIHCYEIVGEDDGTEHTATWDWITVDPAEGTMKTLQEEEIEIMQYWFTPY